MAKQVDVQPDSKHNLAKSSGERLGQLRHFSLRNFLSYGAEAVDFSFESLNVLVGPNGAGKTNFIEALRILKSATTNFGSPMLDSGGVDAYIWRGEGSEREASIEAVFALQDKRSDARHQLDFRSHSGSISIVSEFLGHANEQDPDDENFIFIRRKGGVEWLRRRDLDTNGTSDEYRARPILPGTLRPNESGIEKRQDPETFPLLARIANFYDSIAIYGEWTIGRSAAPRKPVLAGTRSDVLLEDASNLSFVLAELRSTKALNLLRKALKRIKATYEDFSIRPVGGQLQLFIEEQGIVGGINAMRLSDGTLRFLTLAAILLNPNPPRLIVIDEPEIGMHPDLIEAIAEMINEAATRTQLIIATHSPDLLTYMRPSIDRLYAFQAGTEGTEVRGFSGEQLDEYLIDQPLGDLWRQGDLGGNRF